MVWARCRSWWTQEDKGFKAWPSGCWLAGATALSVSKKEGECDGYYHRAGTRGTEDTGVACSAAVWDDITGRWLEASL